MIRKNLTKSKPGQEEIVGFVLIIVLVFVVGVIFLGIMLRKPVPSSNSPEIENFLEASMLTTTDCAINYAPAYDNLGDLIKSCYEDKVCASTNESSCSVLNKSFSSVLNKAFSGERYSGYNLEIAYVNNETETVKEILNISRQGNCSGVGAMKFINAYGGDLQVRLEVCYSES
jgi:hypothetical protein